MAIAHESTAYQNSFRPRLLLAAAMALSGTAGLFSVQTGQPTFNVVFFRCLFGALSLAGWCVYRGTLSNIWKIDRSLLVLTIVSGLCLVLNWAALFEAFRLISIGFTTIIYHLQPFWIVLVGALFLGEPLSRDRLFWLLLAFVGLTFVVWPRLGSIMGDATWASGIAYAVLASLLYAGSTLTARRLKAIDPAVLTIVHCVLGLLIFAPFVSVAPLQNAAFPVWGWLAGLGVIHTGIVYVLLYSNYPKVQTAVIAVCAFLNPAAALLSDYLVFGKSITLVQAAGVCFILLAGLGVTLSWKLKLPPRGATK
ncbi:DMT family transporter [Rhizobium mongolense]|uniref:DMT family transporter n=1 Tax=Rhizobium mongolense TaxID=57676 RepID=UPI0034A536A1